MGVGALIIFDGFSQPSCNQEDGDYPGCGISKMTHASTRPQDGKAFMEKYFNVETPGDECSSDVCDCSSYGVPNILQGRVYAKREAASSHAPPPGDGFGLHLVAVPGHYTIEGGPTVADVESNFTSKFANAVSTSTFDSFLDYTVVFSTSHLSDFKAAFDNDKVSYFVGKWPYGTSQYYSIIVQVPYSQLLLELVQENGLTTEAVQMEQRVPDGVFSETKSHGVDNTRLKGTTSYYIVSKVVNRAVSWSVMNDLIAFYQGIIGDAKYHEAVVDSHVKYCWQWNGATVYNCFTARQDDQTHGDFKVGDLEYTMNQTHDKLLNSNAGGSPCCGADRWFDNHYAVDSRTVDSDKIVAYVNSHNPYHACGNSPRSSSYVLKSLVDPSGLSIQMDTSTSLPNDCSSCDSTVSLFQGDHTNPACTTDMSKCPSISPTPGPTPSHCDKCGNMVTRARRECGCHNGCVKTYW